MFKKIIKSKAFLIFRDSPFKSSNISILRGMSGLVYTISDLSLYKENLGAIGNYNNILLFDMNTSEKLTELKGHSSYIWSIIHIYEYKNYLIASASQDSTIKLWNLQNNTCEITLTGHNNWVTSISLLKSDTNTLISASYDHTVKFWNLDLGSCIKTIVSVFGKGVLNSYFFNETYIVYGSVGNSLKVFDYEKDEEVFTLLGHQNLVNCFCNLGHFNVDLICSGSDDRTIKIWNLSLGTLENTLFGHKECVNSLIHLSGYQDNLLASASDDKSIRIWDLSKYECISQLNFHSSWVKSILHIKSKINIFFSHGDTGSVICWKLIKSNDDA